MVTFRERPSGESGGATQTVVLEPAEIKKGAKAVALARLSFDPQCAAVDAYSSDRTILASRGTCQRKVCAQTSETYPEREWSEMPACRVDDGGCGGCSSQGDDPGPGTVPALLVVVLVVFGMGRRQRG